MAWPNHRPKVCKCRRCNDIEESQTKRARCSWDRQSPWRHRTNNTSIRWSCGERCLDNWRDLLLRKPWGPRQWSHQSHWRSYPTQGYPQRRQYAWKLYNMGIFPIQMNLQSSWLLYLRYKGHPCSECILQFWGNLALLWYCQQRIPRSSDILCPVPQTHWSHWSRPQNSQHSLDNPPQIHIALVPMWLWL